MPMRSLQPFLLLCAVFLLCSCAGQAPPSGGPIDTQPPVIISVYPAPATLYYHDSRIIIEFDKYVDRRSVEGSIFISPSLGLLEFDWSGTEVEISFSDSLRSNTTYVFTVGTDVVDLHNKNRMAAAFSIAFSTGGTIDPGTIVGKVYPAAFSDALSGISIFAYRLDSIDPDTLNPSKQKPDYLTQTGTTGGFVLPHLSLGSYRLFAVRDEAKNMLYDAETDEFATEGARIRLTENDTLRTDVTMRLAREDTTAPRLIKVTALNRSLLLAEVSEPLDTSSLRIENIQLSDTLGTRFLKIRSVAARLPERTEFYVAAEDQDSGSFYQLRLRAVRDLSSNIISASAASIRFVASELPDSNRPGVLTFSVADSAKGVDIQPLLGVRFTKPVKRSDWNTMVELRDSLDRPVALSGGWLNDAALAVRPPNELWRLAWYRILIHTGLLEDLNGRAGKDTTRTVHFRTFDSDLLSSIEGSISDVSSADTLGPLVITASMTGQRNVISRSIAVEKPGPYRLVQVPEGNYVMQAYRDRNRNNRFDAGKVFPFVESERFSVSSDTLKLRARWPLEDVRIQLK